MLLVEDRRSTRLVRYAGASGDFNPVHSDDVHAREVAGLPWVFAHGMLTMGMTGRVVTDVFGVARVEHFGGRFTALVCPGDTVTARATLDDDEPGRVAQLRSPPSTSTVSRCSADVPWCGYRADSLSSVTRPAREDARRWACRRVSRRSCRPCAAAGRRRRCSRARGGPRRCARRTAATAAGWPRRCRAGSTA
ncbi:MAG: MaoC/PaaZ C-terminal domain-containing protein [Marmoricola sp.]